MKTRLVAAGRGAWNFLTVIPGWPDAGKIARTFYVLPLAVPFIVLFLLYGWDRLLHKPEMDAVQAASQPALQLVDEIAALRSASPEAQSGTATADRVRSLIQNAEDLDTQLAAMRATATEHGWAPTLHANDPANETPATAAAPLVFRTVRGRLVPAPDNKACYASLLTLLDRLVPSAKCGSITRLAIRADDQGKIAVELGVRFAARPTDEKTP